MSVPPADGSEAADTDTDTAETSADDPPGIADLPETVREEMGVPSIGEPDDGVGDAEATHRAACESCGWVGPGRASEHDAADDAGAHANAIDAAADADDELTRLPPQPHDILVVAARPGEWPMLRNGFRNIRTQEVYERD